MTEIRRPIPTEINQPERPSIRQIYDTLASWPDAFYEPSLGLERTMTLLNNRIVDPKMTHDLSEGETADLRKINSFVEYQFEKDAALTILSATDSLKAMESFTFFDSYTKLTRLEKALIETDAKDSNGKPWLFVGGGPLPLSAILLAKDYGINSSVIDRSPEAVDLSSALVAKLQRERILPNYSVQIRQSGAETFDDYFDYQVIFVAALAGETPEDKKAIFQRIKKGADSNTHVLARSSLGNRQLLYLPLPQEVYEDFDLAYEVHPHNDVINSMILLKNRPKALPPQK